MTAAPGRKPGGSLQCTPFFWSGGMMIGMGEQKAKLVFNSILQSHPGERN